MKIVIAITLCVALAAASVNYQEKDSQIHFDYDSHKDGLFGFLMTGVVDTVNDQENKVSTFLKLANEIIPLIDVSADGDDAADHKLEYGQQWCFGNVGGVIYTCVNVQGTFWVGWMAYQNGLTGTYDVTYTPFALAQFGGNATFATYPAQVGYGIYLNAIDIQIPIGISLGQSATCYSGSFQFLPVALQSTIFTSLLECQEVLPENQYGCNYKIGATFNHLSYNFTTAQINSFLPRNCFNY